MPILPPDEGYIKYQPHWTRSQAFEVPAVAQLNDYRQKLYDAGLIGAYPDGIGFGNISQRSAAGKHHFTSPVLQPVICPCWMSAILRW